MHILQAENLTKDIRGTRVLDHLTFSMEGGRVYGIVGKNGSGKTMLFRALSGLIELSEGRVLLDGRDYFSGRIYKGRKRGRKRCQGEGVPGIGLIIENSSLYPQLTGFQNLRYLAQIRGVSGDKQVKKAIEALGLDPDDERPFRKYSLGMKQRLLIAQAIMEEPAFLFLDEPTNALDEEGIYLSREQINKAASRGAVVLLASHSREDIQLLCDEVYRMQDGRIVEKRG